MIRTYRDIHMPNSWVVRILGYFVMARPMGHVFAEPIFWVCNYSNMFYKL
jgi:hypothetical protein